MQKDNVFHFCEFKRCRQCLWDLKLRNVNNFSYNFRVYNYGHLCYNILLGCLNISKRKF